MKPALSLLTSLALFVAGCTPPPRQAPASPAPTTGPPAALPGPSVSTDLGLVPKPSQADAPFAGAFALLDGKWEGSFRVYVDSRGQQAGPRRLLTREVLEVAPYRLETTISVQQHYVSESPYFQRVTIRDSWSSGGERHEVTSQGINKVEQGLLWCVVQKPDDLVVHRGFLLARPDTIVWSRARQTPLAIEHFEEQVSATRYTIRGWGYYGEDDPRLAPRLYFDAVYTRPQR